LAPTVTGLVVDFEGQEKFAHARHLVRLGYEEAVLRTEPAISAVRAPPGEVLLERTALRT